MRRTCTGQFLFSGPSAISRSSQAEVVGKQLRERIENRLGIRPFRQQSDLGPLRHCHQHDVENAAGVGFVIAVADSYLGLESVDRRDDGTARSHMQSRGMRHGHLPCGRWCEESRLFKAKGHEITIGRWSLESGGPLLTFCRKRTVGPKSSPSLHRTQIPLPLHCPSQVIIPASIATLVLKHLAEQPDGGSSQ